MQGIFVSNNENLINNCKFLEKCLMLIVKFFQKQNLQSLKETFKKWSLSYNKLLYSSVI